MRRIVRARDGGGNGGSPGREFLRLVRDADADRLLRRRRQGVDLLERVLHRTLDSAVGRDDDRDELLVVRLALADRADADAVAAEDLAELADLARLVLHHDAEVVATLELVEGKHLRARRAVREDAELLERQRRGAQRDAD